MNKESFIIIIMIMKESLVVNPYLCLAFSLGKSRKSEPKKLFRMIMSLGYLHLDVLFEGVNQASIIRPTSVFDIIAKHWSAVKI